MSGGDIVANTVSFTVIITTSFALSVPNGYVGSAVTVTGSGFTASTPISFYWDSSSTPMVTSPATITTNSSGAIPAGSTITIPAAYRGRHYISSPSLGANSQPFDVLSRIVINNPPSGGVGTTVTVTGTGFAATPSNVNIAVDGVNLTGTSPASINATATGGFYCTFLMPSVSSGDHTILASDNGGSASSTFSVVPTIYLSSTSSTVGINVIIYGSGFSAAQNLAVSFETTAGSGVFSTSGLTTIPVVPTTDLTGAFINNPISFAIPGVAAGTHTIKVTDQSGHWATTTITVLPPTMSITPINGILGSQVTITGSGFAPGLSVSVLWDTAALTTIPATVTATSSGTVSATFAAPISVGGAHTVRVQDPTGNSATATFTVLPPTISITPVNGTVGSPVTITGSGFAPGLGVSILWDTTALTTIPVTVTASSTGAVSATFAAPTSVVGAHTVRVQDPSSNSATATFTVQSTISITPVNGTVGTQVTVTGSGFAPGLSVNVFWDTTALTTTPATLTTTSTGTISATFASPLSAGGAHTIKAQDTSSNFANATFTTKPKIVLTPATGAYGDTITITYSGFTASSTVTSTGIISGSAQYSLTTTPATVPIDANGNGTATFRVSNLFHGNWTVQATDSANGSAQATLAVTQKISLNTNTGVAGDVIAVTGTGFAASQGISLKYNGVALTTLPSSVTSEASGAFACQFTVPPTAAGVIPLTASDGDNMATLNFTATAKATISKATSSSDEGFVGQSLTITASGFLPSHAITITYASTPVTLKTVTSDDFGSFTATVTIPASPAGQHTITASDGTTTKTFAFFMDSTAPAAPTLLTPIDKFKPKQPVPFGWGSVIDPSGVTYTLQLSQDATFSTFLLEHTGLTTITYTMTVAEKLASSGSKTPYYWRIRATDAAGNVGAWSTSNTFTIGFIWPSWIIHVWYGLGIVLALILGLWFGRRIAYQSY